MNVKVLDTINGSFVSIDDLICSYQNMALMEQPPIDKEVLTRLIEALIRLRPIPVPKSSLQLSFFHFKRKFTPGV
jgi:hypothetical protein